MLVLKKIAPFYNLFIFYAIVNIPLRIILLFHPITQSSFTGIEIFKIFVLLFLYCYYTNRASLSRFDYLLMFLIACHFMRHFLFLYFICFVSSYLLPLNFEICCFWQFRNFCIFRNCPCSGIFVIPRLWLVS